MEYRSILLRAIEDILALVETQGKKVDPILLDKFHLLVKDLHDLDYGMQEREAEKIRSTLEELIQRVQTIEGWVSVHRIPVGPKQTPSMASRLG